MKRIFLVDDHPMLREGLSRLIENKSGCQICGESETASDALDAIPAAAPDIVLMDISLPDKSGLELIKDLQARFPELRILVFSMHDEMLYAERVMRAGAKGYLMKGESTEKLIEAIDCVLSGGLYLSRRVCDHVLNSMSKNRSPGKAGPQSLTDRELEIFELIGRGRTNAQIAAQLHISPKTVDAHRTNMRTKLSLPDSASLMREAVLWVELAAAN
ncbi:MAG: response regulator transcription factor [Luteolibacter sp.]|uniref:response regulator transcription factor n=1 Tax=Luteolibacter sp. TaxID=1962973 RepID=UPI0032653CFA